MILQESWLASCASSMLAQGAPFHYVPARIHEAMSKLLLIDDEVDVQYSFQRIFDSPEIELTTASSGEEGLKLIPKVKPDLVIMDIRMGGMNGLETLRKIREIDSKLLVI
ncbi:MAG: response regulator, partial [Verrucomicrobiota bacterium]